MSSYYKTMNLLLINDIYNLEITKFMHSFYHGMLPVNFHNFFTSAKTQYHITLEPLPLMVITWKKLIRKERSCHVLTRV